MTMTDDQKFVQALEVIAEIAPYTHLNVALRKARDLVPMLRDDGYKHDEPSEKALSELRDKLTADDDNRPRTPHYAPVGGFDNPNEAIDQLRDKNFITNENWKCPSCPWMSNNYPPGPGRLNYVRVHTTHSCDAFKKDYPMAAAFVQRSYTK